MLATLNDPNALGAAALPLDPEADQAMRTRLFDQFNAFWTQAAADGVPFDVIGTMAMTAALYGLVAKYGPGTAADYLDDLKAAVRRGEFARPADA